MTTRFFRLTAIAVALAFSAPAYAAIDVNAGLTDPVAEDTFQFAGGANDSDSSNLLVVGGTYNNIIDSMQISNGSTVNLTFTTNDGNDTPQFISRFAFLQFANGNNVDVELVNSLGNVSYAFTTDSTNGEWWGNERDLGSNSIAQINLTASNGTATLTSLQVGGVTSVAAVPEPSMAIALLAGSGLVARRLRRKKKAA